MKKTNIRRFLYHLRFRYLTFNNAVIAMAAIVAIGWAWGSVGMMQRNYKLQQEVDAKMRHKQLVELEVQTAKFEQRYYQSEEYQELAARTNLRLGEPGEKVLILPPNTQSAKQADREMSKQGQLVRKETPPSNFQQWSNFLLGGNRQQLQSD